MKTMVVVDARRVLVETSDVSTNIDLSKLITLSSSCSISLVRLPGIPSYPKDICCFTANPSGTVVGVDVGVDVNVLVVVIVTVDVCVDVMVDETVVVTVDV